MPTAAENVKPESEQLCNFVMNLGPGAGAVVLDLLDQVHFVFSALDQSRFIQEDVGGGRKVPNKRIGSYPSSIVLWNQNWPQKCNMAQLKTAPPCPSGHRSHERGRTTPELR